MISSVSLGKHGVATACLDRIFGENIQDLRDLRAETVCLTLMGLKFYSNRFGMIRVDTVDRSFASICSGYLCLLNSV